MFGMPRRSVLWLTCMSMGVLSMRPRASPRVRVEEPEDVWNGSAWEPAPNVHEAASSSRGPSSSGGRVARGSSASPEEVQWTADEMRRVNTDLARAPTTDAEKRALPSIILLGKTGSGKSHLANLLVGDRRLAEFAVGHGLRSQTVAALSKERTWIDEGLPRAELSKPIRSRGRFLLIDTPGLSDTEARDTEHLANMVEQIKLKDGEYHGTSKFVIVQKYAPGLRFDEDIVEMIRVIMQGVRGSNDRARQKKNLVDFFEHLCFTFTAWGEHEVHQMARSYATKEAVAQLWVDELQEKVNRLDEATSLGFEIDDSIKRKIKCFFIECNMMTEFRNVLARPENHEELGKYQRELQSMWTSIKDATKYSCNDIRPVAGVHAGARQTRANAERRIRELERIFSEQPVYVHPAPVPGPEGMDTVTRKAYENGDWGIGMMMNHYNVWNFEELKGKVFCCGGSFIGSGHFHGKVQWIDVAKGQIETEGYQDYKRNDRKSLSLVRIGNRNGSSCGFCGDYMGPAHLKPDPRA